MARTKAQTPITAASKLPATLDLAYANAAPTPKITMNISSANDLFCFILIISIDGFFRSGTTGRSCVHNIKNNPGRLAGAMG
jgi:hypothetical protein